MKARLASAAVLGALALALAITGPSPAGPALVLGLATLAAAGGWLALPLGVLAVALAVGQVDAVAAQPLIWAFAVVAGAGIGLVARRADRALPWLAGPGATGTGVLLCGLALAACLLPDDLVRLFDAHGAPMGLEVVVGDPDTRSRARAVLPAMITHAPPLSALVDALAWSAPVVGWGLLAAAARDSDRWRRGAWGLALALGLLLSVTGLAGLVELVRGTVSVPPADALAIQLAERTGGASAVQLASPLSEGHLTLASRPFVDPVRLVAGALLALLAFGRVRRLRPAPVDAPSSAGGQLPLGLALVVIATALGSPASSAWFLGAGAVLGGGALVGGLFGGPSRRLSHDLVVLAVIVWTLGALAPWTGWPAGA